MKFTIEKLIQGSCRLGVLREVGKQKNLTVETPFCMLYTRAGSVPNLSNDTLGYVEQLPPVAVMPLNVLAEHQEILQEYKKGIAEFSVMKDFVVCCTLQDPCTAVPTGYNDRSSIALWGRGGKMKMDPKQFFRVQAAFQPDWLQCLSDGDTCKTSSKKRCRKAVDCSLNFLDDILDMRKTCPVLQKAALFGSVGGGFNYFERERSAKETAARDVEGFAIEGFQNDGEEFNQFEDKDFVDILQHTLKQLPEEKPRLMSGVWRPDAVLEAVKAGIDIMDTSCTFSAAEKGQAFSFNYNYSSAEEERDIGTQAEQQGSNESGQYGFTIDLTDKRYQAHFGPVLEGCSCYTCRTYSRAYIHHLINTGELQRGVLLMIHNLHHYLGFFGAVRRALQEDKFQQLEGVIRKQMPRAPSPDR